MNRQGSAYTTENSHTLAGDPTDEATTAAVEREVADLFAEGVAHHQAGRLYWANAQYRRVLAALPDHAEALHNLGVIAYQLGQYEGALESINKAIQQDGSNASYFFSRGVALYGLKRLDEAVGAYDHALALKPDVAEALLNRGLALEEQQRFDEALDSYDRALAIRADYAEALNNRGNALRALGRLADALESYDRASVLKPDLAEIYCNRGDALSDLDRLDEAAASFDRALTLAPNLPELFFKRGESSRKLKRLDEAVANYDRALTLKPDYPEALLNRGLALQELERFEDALESYDRALAIRPDYVLALDNRVKLLRQLKRFEEAWDGYDRALSVRLYHTGSLNNRGSLTPFAKPRTIPSPDDCFFYHAMDLPGFGTMKAQNYWDLRGRFEDYTGHVDLRGKRFLEIGAASGFVSFEAERRGAEVVSFDMERAEQRQLVPDRHVRATWNEQLEYSRQDLNRVKNAYWLAHRALGSQAQAFYGDIYNIPEELGPFDVVFFGQVLVHIRDPLWALYQGARLCRDTLVITEGMVEDPLPRMRFIHRDDGTAGPAAWWHLSTKLYEQWLAMLDFGIESLTGGHYPYIALKELYPYHLSTIVARRRTT
jgi:tetratricopeptide (TPR) repeat protein